MSCDELVTSGEIMTEALGTKPDITVRFPKSGWILNRWRCFVDDYSQDAMPASVYIVHMSGKRNLRYWNGADWSTRTSSPGLTGIVPAGRPIRIRVGGELDVTTISRQEPDRTTGSASWVWAFGASDPLGAMLTRQILAQAYQNRHGEVNDYMAAMMTALEAHLDEAQRAVAPALVPTASYSSRRIYSLLERINAHPELDHDLNSLAEIAGVTPPHFCRMFKQVTGKTLREYVNDIRLERARHMLETTDAPISSIAGGLGFNSQSHFNRIFRKTLGVKPSQCRERKTAVSC